MITTNDDEIYKRLLKLRWVGISKDTWSREGADSSGYSWYYNVEELGFKYHMNDIAAAIGRVQLGKLDQANSRRRALSRRYSEGFVHLPEIETPTLKPHMTKPACHNYVIKYRDRDGLNAHLKDAGISTGVHYVPSNHYDMYRGYRGPTPVCDDVWRRLLTLPLYPDLEDSQVDHIITKVKEYVERRR